MTTQKILIGGTWYPVNEVIAIAEGDGGGGVTDHGLLSGLEGDDHPQYLTTPRGDARYLRLTGGTLSGALTLSGNPTNLQHAATKLYVDQNAGGGGVTDHGLLDGLEDDDHPQYLLPVEVVAGENITVDTDTTPGSVIVASTGGGGTPAGGGDLVADGVTILATSATEWEPWQDTLDRYGLVSWDGRRRWVSIDWPGHTDPPDPISGDLWDGLL